MEAGLQRAYCRVTRRQCHSIVKQRMRCSRVISRKVPSKLRAALLECNDATNRPVRIEHPNLPAAKFHASFGVTNRILFRTLSSPVRLNAWPFKTLPAPLGKGESR